MSWPNDHDDIGQGYMSLCATHPRMLVIICVKFGRDKLIVLCIIIRLYVSVK